MTSGQPHSAGKSARHLARPGRSAFVGTLFTSLGIQAATILTGIAMARILGPEGRGLYAAGLLWPSIFAGLGLLGVNHAMTLRAAAHPNDRGELYGTALVIGAVLSGVTILAAFLAISLLMADKPHAVAASYIFLPYIPVFVLASLLISVDMGIGSFRDYNAMRWVLTAANIGAVGVLFLAGNDDPEAYLLALLAANGASLLFKLVRLPWKEIRFTRLHLSVLVSGGSFYLATVATLARDQIERIFLVGIGDVDQLGIYVVALSAAMMPSVLAKSLGLVVFSRSAQSSEEGALLDTARLFRQLTLFNLLLSLGALIALPLLIPVLYGADFNDARSVAAILVFSQLFLAMGSVLDEGMRGQNRPMKGTLSTCVMAIVFLVTALVLFPNFGAIGVAIAATAGQLAGLLTLLISFKRFARHARLAPSLGDLQLLAGVLANLVARARQRLYSGGSA